MDRLERLVNLVAALIDAPRPLTREELRSRVGGYSDDDDAFRRNFERDKDTLRQMGLPLATSPLGRDRTEDQTGYRIPRERYELPDPGLNDEELTALRIAASAVRMEGAWGGDAVVASALRKLAAPAPAAHDVEVAELAGGEAVVTAFAAIADRRRLRFRYRGEERLVDPWRLAYRGGQWYLSGLDHGREAERLFRLDRVEGGVEADGEPGAFERPAAARAVAPAPWRLGEEPEIRAVVVVDAEQAAWARPAAGAGDTVEERPDGSVVLGLRVTNRAALRSFVLGFLDHAEVVAPPDLRHEVVAWLEGIAAGRPA
ncbi:MAG TPA: WYL domain-containing protein [Acidimicrobiales bacterium]|nr:WYL domain-containing protein [Acidimicrobiales bacterium]